MSVTKDKTLATVRTFAQDFKEHAPPGEAKSAVREEQVTPAKVKTAKKTSKEKRANKALQAEAKKFTEQKDTAREKDKEKPKPIPKIKVQPKPKKKKVEKKPVPVPPIVAKRESKQKGPSLSERFSKWLRSLFAGQSNKTPTYSIRETDRRKGVIKKATTKSGAVFTADNETLREAILRRRNEEHEEIDVSWSPNTDVGYDLLEAPHAHSTPPVAPPQPAVTAPTETPVEEARPEPVPAPSDTRWEAETPTVPEAVPQPEPVSEPIPVAPSEPQPVIEVVPPPAVIQAPEVVPTQTRKVAPFRTLKLLLQGKTDQVDTNSFALGIATVVVSVVAIVLVGQTIYNSFMVESEAVAVTDTATLLPNTSAKAVVLEERTATATKSVIANSAGFADVAEQELILLGPDGTAITPQEMIAFLELELNPSLAQTMQEAHLVVVDTVQNAFVFTVTDGVTALGGMLEWEETMYEDTSELLFPISRPAESLSFSDEAFGNVDLRVLSDGTDEVLVYGVIGENTILITKSTNTFKRLAN